MRRERGSVLFLYPVGFLIVLMLGAIAVDLGNVWLQQRRLADAADSAANDAVTYGIDQDVLRTTGRIELTESRIDEIVTVSVSGQDLPPAAVVTTASGTIVDGAPAVIVTIDSSAELIFGRFVRSDGVAISATGVARLDDGT